MAKEKKVKKEKVKKETFLKGVRDEMKKVHLASFKETVKYFLTTLFLVLFLIGFFSLVELVAASVWGVFN